MNNNFNSREQLLIENFLDSLKVERGISNNTIFAYKNDLLSLSKVLNNKRPAKTLDSASNDDITQYIQLLSKQKFSNATQSRKISAIKQFYLFCLNEKIMDINPSLGITYPKKVGSLPKFLSEEEINNMLQTAKSNQNKMLYVMLEVLYATGLRVSELVTLVSSSFLVDDGVLLVNGKGEKERIVPLTQIAYEELKLWLETRWQYYKQTHSNKLYLFPSNRSSQGHISRERFAQLLKELAMQCNIPISKVSPHVIRHSFASHLLNHGANLTTIQNMLGHSDITTTEIYTHVLDAKIKEAIFKHHPLSSNFTKYKK